MLLGNIYLKANNLGVSHYFLGILVSMDLFFSVINLCNRNAKGGVCPKTTMFKIPKILNLNHTVQ